MTDPWRPDLRGGSRRAIRGEAPVGRRSKRQTKANAPRGGAYSRASAPGEGVAALGVALEPRDALRHLGLRVEDDVLAALHPRAAEGGGGDAGLERARRARRAIAGVAWGLGEHGGLMPQRRRCSVSLRARCEGRCAGRRAAPLAHLADTARTCRETWWRRLGCRGRRCTARLGSKGSCCLAATATAVGSGLRGKRETLCQRQDIRLADGIAQGMLAGMRFCKGQVSRT